MSEGAREDFPLDVELLETVIDELPIGAILLDDDGTVRRFNRHEEQLSGLVREQTLGQNFFSEVAPCTEDVEMEARFREGIEEGSLDLDFEFSFPYPYNRVPRDVRIRARSVSDEERRAHVILIEDITSRRQLERNNAEMMSGLRSMISRLRGGDDSRGASNLPREVGLRLGTGDAFSRQALVVHADLGRWHESWASDLAPSELFGALDGRLQSAVDIAHRRGGRVDRISGAGVTAYFFPSEDHPERVLYDALRAAHAISRDGKGRHLEMPFRVALIEGTIYNGPIGWEALGERLTLGDAPERCRELARVARPGELLVAGEELLDQLGEVAELDRMRLAEPYLKDEDVARVGELVVPEV